MAAIKEWFAAYNLIFNYVQNSFGNNALDEYLDFVGERLYHYTGEKTGEDFLNDIDKYFNININMDNGEVSSEQTNNKLNINILKCPDHMYSKETEYESHKFGKEYCKNCTAVYKKLAELGGCTLQYTESSSDNNGIYSCGFSFVEGGK